MVRGGAGKMPICHGVVPPEEPAVLGCCPKTLFLLWDKYVNGIEGDQSLQENLHIVRED